MALMASMSARLQDSFSVIDLTARDLTTLSCTARMCSSLFQTLPSQTPMSHLACMSPPLNRPGSLKNTFWPNSMRSDRYGRPFSISYAVRPFFFTSSLVTMSAACGTSHAMTGCPGGMLPPIRFSRASLSTLVCCSAACTALSALPFFLLSPTAECSFSVRSDLNSRILSTRATIAGSWSLLMITSLWPIFSMSLISSSAAQSVSMPLWGTMWENSALELVSLIATAGIVPSTPGSPMKK